MKSDETYQIEIDKLQEFIKSDKFEEAEKIASRMLKSYSPLDYDLLIKRARIRQCLLRYEDGILDATMAQNISPQRLDAYNVLADFLTV